MSTSIDAFRRVNWSSLTATHAQQRPGAAAVRSAGATVTWQSLDGRVSRLADWLRGAEVGAGDRVAIALSNCVEFIETIVAVARVGAVAVPINFRLSPGEAGFILTDCTPRVVVVDEPCVPMIARSGYPVEHALVIGGGTTGFDQTDYETALAASSPELAADNVGEDAPAWILYTSGTTGTPKGAVLTHLNIFVGAVTNIRASNVSDGEISLVTTPLFHIAALSLLSALFVNGGTAVLAPLGSFDAAAIVDLLEAEHVTTAFFVPAQWREIVEVPGISERTLALRCTSWGAAPATPTLIAKMQSTFPNAQNQAMFGQTEMSPVTCMLRGEDAPRKLGSVGLPLPYVQIRVVHPDMTDVRPGEVGEIVYRGPNLMREYWNRPEATAEAYAGGWFHSGDLVRRDEEGYVYVVDRLKDMIISGGENIYCAEVENAVAAHPSVADVAVIGRSDPKWGEVPAAVVVLRPGHAAPEPVELKALLGDRLAAYKHPRHVVVVDALPRNAAGKVEKYALRETLST